MSIQDMIPANDFCSHHHIEISFLYTLQDYGLIEITNAENEIYLRPDQLEELEKMVRLYYDLHINLEGIDSINHLLHQVKELQSENLTLKQRLRIYMDNSQAEEKEK